jgi:hypothetical protein
MMTRCGRPAARIAAVVAAVAVASPLGELPWFTRCGSRPVG